MLSNFAWCFCSFWLLIFCLIFCTSALVEFVVSLFSSKDLLITSRNFHILDLKFLRRLELQVHLILKE